MNTLSGWVSSSPLIPYDAGNPDSLECFENVSDDSGQTNNVSDDSDQTNYDALTLPREEKQSVEEASQQLFQAAKVERDEKEANTPPMGLFTKKVERAQHTSANQFCTFLKPRKKGFLGRKVKQFSELKKISAQQRLLEKELELKAYEVLPEAIKQEWKDDLLLSKDEKGAFCLDNFWKFVQEKAPAELEALKRAWYSSMHTPHDDNALKLKHKVDGDCFTFLAESHPETIEEFKKNYNDFEVYTSAFKKFWKKNQLGAGRADPKKVEELNVKLDKQFQEVYSSNYSWETFAKQLIGSGSNQLSFSIRQLEELKRHHETPRDFLEKLKDLDGKGKPFYLYADPSALIKGLEKEFFEGPLSLGISYSDFGRAKVTTNKTREESLQEYEECLKQRNPILSKTLDRMFQNATFKKLATEYFEKAGAQCSGILKDMCAEYRHHSETRFYNFVNNQMKFLMNMNYLFTSFAQIYDTPTVDKIKTTVQRAVRATSCVEIKGCATAGSFNFYRNKQIVMPTHTDEDRKICKTHFEEDKKVLKYFFDKKTFAKGFAVLQDAHTAQYPGLYSWEYNQFVTDLRKKIWPDDENLKDKTYYRLRQAIPSDSNESQFSLFQKFIDKQKQKLALPDQNSKTNRFVAKAIYSAMFLALRNASETEHMHGYFNQVLDYESEVNLDELPDELTSKKTTAYKKIIARGMMELLQDAGNATPMNIWHSQSGYFNKLERNLNAKIMDKSVKKPETIEEIIYMHGVYSIMRGYKGNRLRDEKNFFAANGPQKTIAVKNPKEKKMAKVHEYLMRLHAERAQLKSSKKGRIKKARLNTQIAAYQSDMHLLKV